MDREQLPTETLKLRIEELEEALKIAKQEKADLEILLEATTEHSAMIESELEKAQAELNHALEQEKALNQRIEELATLEERNRIARDIHDSLGHLLVGLNVQMETALALWKDDPARAHQFLTKAKQLGSNALQATRESVSDIRSSQLDLESDLTTLMEDFQRTTGIEPLYQINLSQSLSEGIKRVIYRFVQEGLTNICKHAKATTVSISIQSTDTGLLLTLQDNGKGFPIDVNPSGFGLQGMQERIKAVGGTLNIVSEIGQGCCITVFLPLNLSGKSA